MKLLKSGEDIRGALKVIKPSRVAVAYVGAGWKRYVDKGALKEVVLSPTLGSNPSAILELMEDMTPEKVHFLDHLHSKFYVGEQEVLVGSCNLSDNAMGDGGKHEVAIYSQDRGWIEELNDLFDSYVEQAQRLYPSLEAKLARIDKLKLEHGRAQRLGVLTEPRGISVPTLDKFQWFSGRRIHIAWWSHHGDESFDRPAIDAAHPAAAGLDLEDYFSDWMHFHANDDVREGDWVITWRCVESGRPSKRKGSIAWMRVDKVFSDGSGDDDYKKLATQIGPESSSDVPFQLDARAEGVIRDLLESGGFQALLPPRGDSIWTLEHADAVVGKFLMAAKERYSP